MTKETKQGAAGATNDSGAQGQPPANPPAEPAKGKKARVLVATTIRDKLRQPNDVITVDDATLKAHAGELDADPAAVKYAESLKASAE